MVDLFKKHKKADNQSNKQIISKTNAQSIKQQRSQNGRKSISNPTSPVSQPKRAISSPEELGGQEEQVNEKTPLTQEFQMENYNQVAGLLLWC